VERKRIADLPEEQQKAAIFARVYRQDLQKIYAKVAGGFKQTYELVRCFEESFLSL